jgi:hypothetical protein
MVDINKVVMKEGYNSATDKKNAYMHSLMHVEVVDAGKGQMIS